MYIAHSKKKVSWVRVSPKRTASKDSSPNRHWYFMRFFELTSIQNGPPYLWEELGHPRSASKPMEQQDTHDSGRIMGVLVFPPTLLTEEAIGGSPPRTPTDFNDGLEVETSDLPHTIRIAPATTFPVRVAAVRHLVYERRHSIPPFVRSYIFLQSN